MKDLDWQRLPVAPERTHHLDDDAPAYTERFDGVLPFHAPGFAPVYRGGEAWHIDGTGQPVYAHRFLQTFGFYEGRSAVVAPAGWLHILPDGSALYSERYAWCGNYQKGRVAVRRLDGAYLHLDLKGEPAYSETWRYAGDYREGAAVVQGEDGLSTHVDLNGHLLHRRWFDDLDVYHKGFARARMPEGWTHVDRAGMPLYERRFVMAEPFYNGQARVELFGGALEVIDELGRTVHRLRGAR